MSNFLLGADPEVFVRQADKFLSAHGMVEGTKLAPHPVENGAVQVDGMALEFNIDPANDEEAFVYNIQHVMAQLKAMVPDYEVVATPVAHFTPEYIEEQPWEAKQLGCEPDYNAWTGSENEKPDMKKPWRTASGHVHMGWTDTVIDEAHLGMCSAFIKQSDFILGLPSLLYDGDVERREMYGKAGAFRPKTYGAEYRVLSNRWLSDPALIRWVYRASLNTFTSMGCQLVEKYGDIQDIINNSDVDAAWRIIKAEGILVPAGV